MKPFEYFITYCFLFIIGGTGGYLIEILFRRFFSMKKRINPGFLKGPCLPLYGFGVCILHFLSTLFFQYCTKEGTYNSFYNSPFYTPSGNLPFWGASIIIIFVVGVSMTLLEYIAGIIFVKGFHIKLWDYSSMKGNIQGLICPLFSFLRLCVGTIYRFTLRPLIDQCIMFFINHMLVITFFIGAYLAVFILDFYNSVQLSLKIRTESKMAKIVTDYEQLKLKMKEKHFKNTKKNLFSSAVKESAAPITSKLNRLSYNLKKHLYINNEIPSKTAAEIDETPRTIDKNK